MFQIASELRHGLRGLWRDYGFTVAVIASLTLGIGANSAIFTVVNALLLQSLPYGDPDRLILVQGSIPALGWEGITIAPAEFQRYRDQSTTLTDLVAYTTRQVNVSGSGAPRRVLAAQVGGGFFEAFGIRQTPGFFDAGPDSAGEASVLVSTSFWKRQLGGDPRVAGTPVRIDDRTYVVAGVAPDGFDFPREAEIWMPLPSEPQFWASREPAVLAVGLLQEGASLEQARAELAALAEGFSRDFPDTHGDRAAYVTDLRERLVGEFRGPIRLLSGAALFVLLTATLNAFNLSLTRTLARSREVAVRSAGSPGPACF